MHMRKMKYVPSPEIMPNPKIPHPSPGDYAWSSRACKKFMVITKNKSLTMPNAPIFCVRNSVESEGNENSTGSTMDQKQN